MGIRYFDLSDLWRFPKTIMWKRESSEIDICTNGISHSHDMLIGRRWGGKRGGVIANEGCQISRRFLWQHFSWDGRPSPDVLAVTTTGYFSQEVRSSAGVFCGDQNWMFFNPKPDRIQVCFVLTITGCFSVEVRPSPGVFVVTNTGWFSWEVESSPAVFLPTRTG